MFEFVDDSFNRENSFENILSIQLGLNGFSFCIRTESGHLLYLKQLAVSISNDHLLARRFEDWCNEEELLLLPYREKQIYYTGNRFSLVPKQLDSESVNADIRQLVMAADADEEYAENWIEEIEAKLLFMLPRHLNKALQENLGDHRIMHLVQKLIALSAVESHDNKLLLFFNDKDLFFLLRKNQRLELCNVFHIQHENDAVYYVLAASRQLQVAYKNCNLTVAGKSVFRAQTMKHLSAYFGSVEPLVFTHHPSSGETDVSELVCLL